MWGIKLRCAGHIAEWAALLVLGILTWAAPIVAQTNEPPTTDEAAAVKDEQIAAQASPTPESFAEYGQLEVQIRQVRRPTCWTLILRGNIANPYDEPIEGVRLIVRLRGDGEQPREMERLEAEMHTTIKAKAAARFDRTLTTGCTSNFSDISIVAFAEKRNGEEIAKPSAEVEIAASKASEAASSAGNTTSLGFIGGWGGPPSGR